MTLTRRDRAAMVLALECLRADSAFAEALRYGDEQGFALWACVMGVTYAPEPVGSRLLRARLALYLRALLRADEYERSDHGWNFSTPPVRTVVCDRCAQALPFYEVGDAVNACPMDGKPSRARYAIPLWELAAKGRGE